VIGKRQKERTVPVSIATLEALKAHWADRGRDFMAQTDLLNSSAPLLSPVTVPRTHASLAKHGVKHHQRSNEGEQGYWADGINRLVSRIKSAFQILLAPVEHLIRIHFMCSRHFRYGSTRHQRLSDDLALLFHRTAPIAPRTLIVAAQFSDSVHDFPLWTQ